MLNIRRKEEHEKLFMLCEKILRLLKEEGIYPILYGGLAVAYYTKDEDVKIGDIDFLVSETFMPLIQEKLSREDDLSIEVRSFNGIKIIGKSGEKIEIDSVEQTSLTEFSTRDVLLCGTRFTVLGMNGLLEIYLRSAAISEKKNEKYGKDLEKLYRAKTKRYETL